MKKMVLNRKLKINLKKLILSNENLSDLKQFDIVQDFNKFISTNEIIINEKRINRIHQSDVSKLLNFEKMPYEKIIVFLYFIKNKYKISLDELFHL